MLQFTSKDWIVGSVEGSYILEALLQQQLRVSCTKVGSADQLSVKVWDTRGTSSSHRNAVFLFRWGLSDKATLFAWSLTELHLRYICLSTLWIDSSCLQKVPHSQFWVGSWASVLHFCEELPGAGLRAATFHCRVSSSWKLYGNNSQVSNRAPICLNWRKTFHMELCTSKLLALALHFIEPQRVLRNGVVTYPSRSACTKSWFKSPL